MVQPAPARRPVIEFAQRTDPGRDPNKQVNEDTSFYRESRWGHLFVVCDGMGGHSAGQEASRLAVSTIFQVVEGSPDGMSPGQLLHAAIAQAGRTVYQLGGAVSNPARPGSTCVALLFHPGGVEVGHVGDSRAYVIRGGQIWPLTRDHSIVQQMIDARMLSPEQAYGHPDANKITRALGMRPEVEPEVREQPLPYHAGDIFLLATDGLCDLARPDEILGVVLSAGATDRACQALVDFANARGGHDNITVQIARVIDGGLGVGPGSAYQTVPDGPIKTQAIAGPPPQATVPELAATMLSPGAPAPVTIAGAGGGAPPPGTVPRATAPDFIPYAIPNGYSSDAYAAVTAAGARAAKPSSRGPVLIAVAITLVVLILGAIGSWWLFFDKTGGGSAPPTASATPASSVLAPPPKSVGR